MTYYRQAVIGIRWPILVFRLTSSLLRPATPQHSACLAGTQICGARPDFFVACLFEAILRLRLSASDRAMVCYVHAVLEPFDTFDTSFRRSTLNRVIPKTAVTVCNSPLSWYSWCWHGIRNPVAWRGVLGA